MTHATKQQNARPETSRKLSLNRETVRQLGSGPQSQGRGLFGTHNCPTDVASCVSFQATCVTCL